MKHHTKYDIILPYDEIGEMLVGWWLMCEPPSHGVDARSRRVSRGASDRAPQLREALRYRRR